MRPPAPSVQFPAPNVPIHAQLQYQAVQSQQPYYHYRPQLRMPQPATAPAPGQVGFDGRMLRKAMARKTVDYNSSVVNYLEHLTFSHGQREILEPDILFTPNLLPPQGMIESPCNCVMTKFIRPATNKNRCPIFSVCWTPDGRRLLTGASSGEFTLWNGLTFNFETILQAHDSSIRCMRWSHNEQWLLTCDQMGFVKYWQSNMNNVKMISAHKDAVRQLSFSPNDIKFATCSDDGTVRIFDFFRFEEEAVLKGHGSDVKCVDWHPFRGMIISGSKDSQHPVIVWDPRSHRKIGVVQAHKNTCTDLKFNQINGNWLVTASRDHLCKLFDIRNMSEEVRSFRGHKREACTLAWHPIHETLFASGGSDGSLYFWDALLEDCLAGMDDAHDGLVWDLSWHPLGHMLVSGSNDHTTRFWTRNRPGDTLIAKREERPLAGLEEAEKSDNTEAVMDKAYEEEDEANRNGQNNPAGQFNLPISVDCPGIPNFEPESPVGFGLSSLASENEEVVDAKRVMIETLELFADFGVRESNDGNFEETSKLTTAFPNQFSKPVPKTFERAWKSGRCRPGTVVEPDIFTGPTGTVAEAVVDAQALLSDWQQQSNAGGDQANNYCGFSDCFQNSQTGGIGDSSAVGAAAAVEALRDFPFGMGVEQENSGRSVGQNRRPPLLSSPPPPRIRQESVMFHQQFHHHQPQCYDHPPPDFRREKQRNDNNPRFQRRSSGIFPRPTDFESGPNSAHSPHDHHQQQQWPPYEKRQNTRTIPENVVQPPTRRTGSKRRRP